jgi:hypothetical protein
MLRFSNSSGSMNLSSLEQEPREGLDRRDAQAMILSAGTPGLAASTSKDMASISTESGLSYLLMSTRAARLAAILRHLTWPGWVQTAP